VFLCVVLCRYKPWHWTDPPPEESYQMSKGSISKKEIPTPEKGIRKNEKEEVYEVNREVRLFAHFFMFHPTFSLTFFSICFYLYYTGC
jgi:hypothetical protein